MLAQSLTAIHSASGIPFTKPQPLKPPSIPHSKNGSVVLAQVRLMGGQQEFAFNNHFVGEATATRCHIQQS